MGLGHVPAGTFRPQRAGAHLPGRERGAVARARHLSPADDRRELGARGERAVEAWYLERGYRLLERNWRCAQGELDLVLLGPHGDLVVFCEVKTRHSGAYGSPFEAVTPAKQRRLRRLAGAWVRTARPADCRPTRLRVDVAGVQRGPSGAWAVEVVEDAC
ncbi:MAG: YraN family protein [Acidimicrobiales bacterium]